MRSSTILDRKKGQHLLITNESRLSQDSDISENFDGMYNDTDPFTHADRLTLGTRIITERREHE